MSKAGRIYRVRIPGKVQHLFGGKDRFAKAFVDEVAARAWEADRQREIALAQSNAERTDQLGPTVPSILFGEALARWLRQCDVRPKTRKGYEELARHLGPQLGRLAVTRVGRAAILEHFDRRRRDRERPASPGNLARDLWLIQAVLRWAQERGHQIDQTAFRVKKPKGTPTITRRFDPEAVERFLAGADHRQRAILEVAAWTGMRGGELRAFACEWILWREGRIQVPHDLAYSPKNKKPRSIPLDAVLRDTLERWLDGRREGLVFPPVVRRTGGRPARGPDVRGIFRRVRAASGVKLNGLHDLRHHYLSMLAYLGLKQPEVQAIAGHSTGTMTQRYMHPAPDYLGRAREVLDRARVGSKPGSEPKMVRSRKGR